MAIKKPPAKFDDFEDFAAEPEPVVESAPTPPVEAAPQRAEKQGTPGDPRERLLALVEELKAVSEEVWPAGRTKLRAGTKLYQFTAYINMQFPETEETE